MKDDSKTILERLSDASVSDDLKHHCRLCDVDHMHALGKAGAKEKGVGSALMGLDMTLERSRVVPAIRETQEIVRILGKRHGWSLSPQKVRRIAMEALRHYLNSACHACKGRGMLGVDRRAAGAPQRPRSCTTCEGSGRRPLPDRYQKEIRATLYAMERARRETGARVRKILRVKADVE